METKNDNSNQISPLTREELQEELKKLKSELVLALDKNAKKEAKEKEECDRKWVLSILGNYIDSLKLTPHECESKIGSVYAAKCIENWPESELKKCLQEQLENTCFGKIIITLGNIREYLKRENLSSDQYTLLYLCLRLLHRNLYTDVLFFHISSKINITSASMQFMSIMLS